MHRRRAELGPIQEIHNARFSLKIHAIYQITQLYHRFRVLEPNPDSFLEKEKIDAFQRHGPGQGRLEGHPGKSEIP
jgi:hypothetical protein